MRTTVSVLFCITALVTNAFGEVNWSGAIFPAVPTNWTSTTDGYIGTGGYGTLTITNSGEVYNQNAHIGYDGGTGVVTVMGSGSIWTNSASLHVGSSNGVGTLNIEDGGSVYSGYSPYSPPITSTATEDTYIGSDGGTGAVTVSGSNSVFSASGTFYVNNGTLAIDDGAAVYTGGSGISSNDVFHVTYTHIGSTHGSGAVSITGSNSIWVNNGALYVGYLNDGSLTIEDGATVSSGFRPITNHPFTVADSFVGYLGTGVVTVTGSGSIWTNAENIHVGSALGDGTLNIENGGAVYGMGAFIGTGGEFLPGTGAVTISGSNSVLSTLSSESTLAIGYNFGSGTLDIVDGAKVYSRSTHIGDSAGSGVVTVTGEGSLLSSASTIYVGSQAGDGTLNIEDGGMLHSRDSLIGYTGGTGMVTVDGGGSVWSNSRSLYLGSSGGQGTLLITNGGVVHSESSYIGAENYASGEVTVTGSGSTWMNEKSLVIGAALNAVGRLIITDGGIVNVGDALTDGYLTAMPGSSILLASGGRLSVTKDATLNNALVEFELADSEASGRLVVGGTLHVADSTLKVSSVEPLAATAEHELISASLIDGEFDTSNTVLSVYDVSLTQTATNVKVTINGVRQQVTATPALAAASVGLAQVSMLNISKDTNLLRSLLRNPNSSRKSTSGGSGSAQRLDSGEWVAYFRQFSDRGKQDANSSRNGVDWQSYGYMIGMEKLASEQLILGFGVGQAWIDVDDGDSSDGNAEMLTAALYGNWCSDISYYELGLVFVNADNDVTRIDTALDGYKGSYDSKMFGGWLEAGWLARKTVRSELEPYIRSTYLYGSQDPYRDAGGNSPMSVSANGTDNLLLEGGTRLSLKWNFQNAKTIRTEFKAGARCELLDDNVTIKTVVEGANQEVQSPEANRVALVFGARADCGISDSWSIGVGYEPFISGNWYIHTIDFLLKYWF